MVMAITAAVGVGSVAIAAPAAAASCTSGYICLFSDVTTGGSQLSIPSLPGSCYSLGGGWNDIASSVITNLGYAVRLRDNWDCTGQSIYLGPAAPNTINNFGWPNVPSMNDRISAIQFYV